MVALKAKHEFLFPINAVKEVYWGYFLKQLQQHIDKSIVTMTEEPSQQATHKTTGTQTD